MDPDIILLSEVSQTQKNKYYIIPLICGIDKNDKKRTHFKKKHTDFKIKLMVTRGKLWKGEGINWEDGINTYTLLCKK